MKRSAARENAAPSLSRPPPARRVLIVEDHPDSRETLRMLLEAWGYQVEDAEDGRQGVRKLLDWQPDAAVVDIGLPFVDGFEVALQVRAALQDNILLIALTAYGQPEDRERALASGFDFFMTKPADLERLSCLLERWA